MTTIEHSPAKFISDIDEFKKEYSEVQTFDPLNSETIEEIIVARYGKTHIEEPEVREVSEMMQNDPSYGSWVHYPWLNRAIRFPAQEDHYAARTSRNKMMLTEDEQAILASKKIAFGGLSVGSSVALGTVQIGVGEAGVVGIDEDTVGILNLNRIRANLGDVGLKKAEWLGREIALIDPHINQVLVSDKYTPETNGLLDEVGVDMFVEEVDNLAAKAHIRQYAKERGIPLVSVGDFAETSVVDIERHDKEDVKPFNGRLSKNEYEALLGGELTPEQEEKMKIKIVGMKNITPRLLDSVMNPDLDGLPQLPTTVSIGAGLGVTAITGIFLGRNDTSGTFRVNQRKALGLKPQKNLLESASTWRKFATRKKS